MNVPSLQPFALVEGTALSLRYGHQSSVDLDLFHHNKFEHSIVVKELESTFGQRFVYKEQHTHFGIFCFIDDVKVDIVHYPHLPIARILLSKIFDFTATMTLQQ